MGDNALLRRLRNRTAALHYLKTFSISVNRRKLQQNA